MGKRDLFEWIDEDEPDLKQIGKDIWDNPELGLHEEYASETLIRKLEEEGFEIEKGVGGMPTAFVASYGEGGPRIGILGEYDALPGLSQEVAAERSPIEEGGPGHGCGHNLFGTAGVGAAIAVKKAIEKGDVSGTIVFLGCPAEETLVGKTYMARDGVFDSLDAALTFHPGDLTQPWAGSSNAMDSIQFEFEGTSAHAAAAPSSGRSALDAVELMNLGVEFMREHISDGARIHYSIPDGGGAPNVVPGSATVWYFNRAPEREEVERNTEWIRDIAEAAAKMTQTEVSERFLTGCYDYQANKTLTEVIWENMEEIEPIDYDEADYEFAAELKDTIPEEQISPGMFSVPEEIAEKVRDESLYPEPIEALEATETMPASTEVGDVSWITPTAQFSTATWPVGAPAHTWQVVAANGDFALKGIAYTSKVLAGAAYDMMADSEKLQAVREEFETEIGQGAYETPLPEDAEPPFDMTAD